MGSCRMIGVEDKGGWQYFSCRGSGGGGRAAPWACAGRIPDCYVLGFALGNVTHGRSQEVGWDPPASKLILSRPCFLPALSTQAESSHPAPLTLLNPTGQHP